MTTLAGQKIRAYREAQVPKLSRKAFGAQFGVAGHTVTGWELSGKIPLPVTLRKLVNSGVVQHEDWYLPGRADAVWDGERASAIVKAA